MVSYTIGQTAGWYFQHDHWYPKRLQNMCLRFASRIPLWGSQRLCKPFLELGDERIPCSLNLGGIALHSSHFCGKVYQFCDRHMTSGVWNAFGVSFGSDFCPPISKQVKAKGTAERSTVPHHSATAGWKIKMAIFAWQIVCFSPYRCRGLFLLPVPIPETAKTGAKWWKTAI